MVRDAEGHFLTPAKQRVNPHMTRAFEFGALSALPLFPVLSREEMRADDGNELAAADYPTKPRILAVLRQSADDAGAALRALPHAQAVHALQLVEPFLEHTSEHYGQLVVYARQAGVVPPASRT